MDGFELISKFLNDMEKQQVEFLRNKLDQMNLAGLAGMSDRVYQYVSTEVALLEKKVQQTLENLRSVRNQAITAWLSGDQEAFEKVAAQYLSAVHDETAKVVTEIAHRIVSHLELAASNLELIPAVN